MTFFEWYALAAPFILLAFGLVIYGYAEWDANRTDRVIAAIKRQHHGAAE